MRASFLRNGRAVCCQNRPFSWHQISLNNSVFRNPCGSPVSFSQGYFATVSRSLCRPPCQSVKQRVIANTHSFTTVSCRLAQSHPSHSEPSTPNHTLPEKGLIRLLPEKWIPYAELIRLDKPTGALYLFFPCLFSTLLAAQFTTPVAAPFEIFSTAGLFLVGSFVMRGAGCAINDLWDRNLDCHVERTKHRPLARKAITPQNAIIFTGAQLIAGLGILLQFPPPCLWYGIPSMLLVTIYPLAKRFTHYPQFVLGLAFSWGAIMGFPALGIDILNSPSAAVAASALYASCVSWTMLYDAIYAHMDAKDDVRAGIKSIALKHKDKSILYGLAVTQIGLLTGAGIAAGAGPFFWIGSCGSASLTLALMISRVQLKNALSCWWWFKNGCWFTGCGIALGLFGEYIVQL